MYTWILPVSPSRADSSKRAVWAVSLALVALWKAESCQISGFVLDSQTGTMEDDLRCLLHINPTYFPVKGTHCVFQPQSAALVVRTVNILLQMDEAFPSVTFGRDELIKYKLLAQWFTEKNKIWEESPDIILCLARIILIILVIVYISCFKLPVW